MSFKDFPRTFFVLFSDGDTFYFTVTATKEIQCPRLKNIYESNKNIEMPSISILEFIGNQFVLKNDKGEIIYSLDQYRKDISKVLPTKTPSPIIEKVYIDDDVRDYLLSEDKLQYSVENIDIPGLLYQSSEENKTSSYTRKKVKA